MKMIFYFIKYLLSWCLCCLLFAGCSTDNEKSLSAIFKGLQVEAKAEVTKIHSRDITTPLYTECYKNLLICANFHGEKKIRIYDLTTGEIVNEFLNIGKGPDEILNVSSMHIFRDSLIIYCQNSRKIVSTPLEGLFTTPVKLTVTSSYGNYSRFLPLDKGFFATMTLSDRFGYLHLNNKKGNVQVLEYFPDDRISSFEEKSIAYQGVLCGNPTGKEFVYGSSFGLIFRFMELKEKSAKKNKEYIFKMPSYISDSKPQKQNFAVRWANDALRGVLSMTGSDKHCFILCEENKKVLDKNWRASSVYVFTWEGTPVQKIYLERAVENIAYHASSKSLIALTSNDNDEPEFVFYRIRMD